MTVLEQLKKLDAQRSKLIDEAKAEALAKAQQAVSDLNELGFSYQLTEPHQPKKTTTTRAPRQSGIRQQVLDTINKHPDGITRSQLLDLMNAKNDKSKEQAVSNAVSALKKAQQIGGEKGLYSPL